MIAIITGSEGGTEAAGCQDNPVSADPAVSQIAAMLKKALLPVARRWA
jgi:hypothetical protein